MHGRCFLHLSVLLSRTWLRCGNFAVMKRFLVLAVLATVVVACQRGRLSPEEKEPEIEETELAHGMIVLGDRLEDPYTVANMTKALSSVYPTKAGRVVLETTDLYVRFLPEDEGQYETLARLCPKMLDHPVDYRIVREGDYYHDPELGDDELTWQYAVVPVDFKFPEGIRYELLDECFIPSENTKAGDIDWVEVEREAYRITGNEGSVPSGTKAGEGVPSGRITVADPDSPSGVEGLKGVLVSCNSFVKFSNVYTDEDGCYTMTRSFAGDPRYRIVFKNVNGFGIGFNLLLVPASVSTLGSGPVDGVDAEIDTSSDRKLFTRAVVNNAGFDYYKACASYEEPVRTPPANLRIWLFQNLSLSCAAMLQQGALVDGSLLDDFLGEYMSIVKSFLPDLVIGLDSREDYASIYAAAIHMFAHASHYMNTDNQYWGEYLKNVLKSFVLSGFVTYGIGNESGHGYCEVGEMWAYYVENVMYEARYPDSSDIFGTGFWFSPQILMSLDERGLDCGKIFSVLTSDVCDKDAFQDKLLSYYPQFKAVINQAFGRYN